MTKNQTLHAAYPCACVIEYYDRPVLYLTPHNEMVVWAGNSRKREIWLVFQMSAEARARFDAGVDDLYTMQRKAVKCTALAVHPQTDVIGRRWKVDLRLVGDKWLSKKGA